MYKKEFRLPSSNFSGICQCQSLVFLLAIDPRDRGGHANNHGEYWIRNPGDDIGGCRHFFGLSKDGVGCAV